MAMQEFKMFMVVNTGTFNHGEVELQSYKPDESPKDSFFAKRLLCEVEVEADVPSFDIVMLEIENLEAAVQKEKADSQVRVNILLDRLSKLKAIGHDAPVNS